MPATTLDKNKRTRDEMWVAILRLKEFTIRDIAKATNTDGSSVGVYLAALEKAGFVEVERRPNDGRQVRKFFKLIPGKRQLETPRPRADGTMVQQGLGNEQLWRSMRMMKTFTPTMLAAHATTEKVQVKVETARTYVKHLRLAGYLRVTRPSKPGREAEYMMLSSKYTGPKPPKVRRGKQVFDPNTGQIVWPKEEANG